MEYTIYFPVLGPPLWLEGDMGLLTPEEPCRIRVVSAEVWRIVQARDFKHFERVTKFLDVTYMLVPRLVTSIRHMKIVFGLQTLVRRCFLTDGSSMRDCMLIHHNIFFKIVMVSDHFSMFVC